MIRVHVSALQQGARRLYGARGRALDGLALRVAEHMLEGAIERSPVDTGKLKAAWRVSETGNLKALVENPTRYASFVEFGRRNRFGGRFVPGQRFMTGAMEETKEHLPKIVKAHLQVVLEGVFR